MSPSSELSFLKLATVAIWRCPITSSEEGGKSLSLVFRWISLICGNKLKMDRNGIRHIQESPWRSIKRQKLPNGQICEWCTWSSILWKETWPKVRIYQYPRTVVNGLAILSGTWKGKNWKIRDLGWRHLNEHMRVDSKYEDFYIIH